MAVTEQTSDPLVGRKIVAVERLKNSTIGEYVVKIVLDDGTVIENEYDSWWEMNRMTAKKRESG